MVVDHLWAGGVVAVLGGIADRVAHVLQPTFVDEIDDQLELVQAFEVGDLRLIPGLDRKSTRLNSSHANISYAVFCLKKKNNCPDRGPLLSTGWVDGDHIL